MEKNIFKRDNNDELVAVGYFTFRNIPDEVKQFGCRWITEHEPYADEIDQRTICYCASHPVYTNRYEEILNAGYIIQLGYNKEGHYRMLLEL